MPQLQLIFYLTIAIFVNRFQDTFNDNSNKMICIIKRRTWETFQTSDLQANVYLSSPVAATFERRNR